MDFKLSEQQKEMFFDKGAIGRGIRRRAQTKKGLGDCSLIENIKLDEKTCENQLQLAQNVMFEKRDYISR